MVNFMQRVCRPRGGFNEWLHWLPVSMHRKLEHVMRRFGRNRVLPLPLGNNGSVANTQACYHYSHKKKKKTNKDFGLVYKYNQSKKHLCWKWWLWYLICLFSWIKWEFHSSGRLKLMHLAGEHGDSAGLSDILEADAKKIANMARETFDKYVLLPLFHFFIFSNISWFILLHHSKYRISSNSI